MRRTKFSKQLALDLANCSLSANRKEGEEGEMGRVDVRKCRQLCVIVHLAYNRCVFLCVCVCGAACMRVHVGVVGGRVP